MRKSRPASGSVSHGGSISNMFGKWCPRQVVPAASDLCASAAQLQHTSTWRSAVPRSSLCESTEDGGCTSLPFFCVRVAN